MDLLGKKSKALLEQVVTRAEQLEVQTSSYANLAFEYKVQAEELYKMLQARDSLIRDLTAESIVLKQALVETTKPKPPPHHVSDEESELKWQLDQGYINLSDYENILKELEFQNAEIQLDPDFRLPPDTTY